MRDTAQMTRIPKGLAERYSEYLLAIAAVSGDEAECWASEYRSPKPVRIRECHDRSILLMRQRRMAAGRNLLHQMRVELDSGDGLMASVIHVLERWYYGAVAFYHYQAEEFEQADVGMRQAHDAVRRAIDHGGFLVPMAHHCYEFRLHLARIARNQRRWQELRHHLEVAKEMVEDRRPLCVLDDGTPIDFSSLRDFLSTLSLDEEKAFQESYQQHLVEETRMRFFKRLAAKIYLIPGFSIPYP